MKIIPQPTRKQQLEREKRALVFSSKKFDADLYWEIEHALLIASNVELARWFWERDNPQCEHDLRRCPICHTEREYDPRWDYPAPAVQ